MPAPRDRHDALAEPVLQERDVVGRGLVVLITEQHHERASLPSVRRARLEDAEGSFTTAEWEALLAQFDACSMCERRWEEVPPPTGRSTVVTRDHIIPISKGGSNNVENIQHLRYSCNSRTGDEL